MNRPSVHLNPREAVSKVKNHRKDAKIIIIDFQFPAWPAGRFAPWRLSGERKK
jgi:hypothetical protein